MVRLIWVAPDRVDPEESFPALRERRPSPEPVSFVDAPHMLSKSLADVVLVDGRDRSPEAGALIRKLRNETEAPILIVLTETDLQEFDWSSGPAEFVLDDCSAVEFNARVERLTHPDPEPAELMRRGDVTINRERFEVRVRGEVLDLTFKEFELLEYLAARPGKVCSRRDLLSEVWGYDFFGGTRTVDVHIRRLRAKLGPAAHAIETVRNVGYRFAGG
jgi:DNA-binding response OmpR family regulator